MASVILKSAGAAVGNALLPGVGGALLGSVGAGVGSLVDNRLGLGTQVTGPQLNNLSVQDSRYGAGLPVVYGTARIAGNVIWSSDLIEAQHVSSAAIGGKGGIGGGANTTTTSFTYSVHCAIGICAGPIAGLTTVWADHTIICQNGVWAAGLFDGVAFYTGAAADAPDPFMQSVLGAGNVPACRGLAYIVFDNLQLAAFGNRLPNLTFEIAPATVSANPVLTGSVDAQVSQQDGAVQSGTMPPLSLTPGGGDVTAVLVGGYVASGGTVSFGVSTLDVSAEAPVLLTRITSAAFAATPSDNAWALSPDGRFVALYLKSSTAPTHMFALYDSVAQSFGPVLSANLDVSTTVKTVAWLDSQRFVIDDSVGGARGLHVFARAGLGIVDLGFTPVWGSGSTAATQVLLGAAFTPFGGGLIAYVYTTATQIFQACPVAWRGNALTVGAAYGVASFALGSGSGAHAHLIQTAVDEWTLAYASVVDLRLLSFTPGLTAATVTRPWQILPFGFGLSTTTFPVGFGDRLLVIQRGATENDYRLAEIGLGSGAFTTLLPATLIGGFYALDTSFAAIRLDGDRLLLMGEGGFTNDIEQLAIVRRNAGGSVAAIVADLLTRAGYAAGDYDVSALDGVSIQGYVVQDPMSARAAIAPLQIYTPFDLVESAGQLIAVPRGGAAVALIPAAEWRAAADGAVPPPPLLTARAQELDLPLEVSVSAIDPDRNYEINSQRARRIATAARTVQAIALPVVTDADTLKQIAERALYTAWAERDLIRLTVSRSWLALDPGDVIDLGNGTLLRLAAIKQSGGVLALSGYPAFAPALSSAALADGGQGIIPTSLLPLTPALYLLDLPLLQATDDQPGFYAAAGNLAGSRGAALLRSADGVTYDTIGQLNQNVTAGMAVTTLAAGAAFYQDNANVVQVQLTADSAALGGLSSCAFADLCNGANAALLGGEIIQFQTAILAGPGLYTLTGLLRGRRGTEGAIATHATGEAFLLLQPGAVDFIPARLTDRGQGYDFRALAAGQSLGSAGDHDFTYGLQTICPFAPADIHASRSSGVTGDVTVTWKRRARLNAEWVDYVDVPLDESAELYGVSIMNGATVIRAFTGLTAPTVTYTAAQQSADWGGTIPATFTCAIWQVSARYGPGQSAVVTV